MDQLGARVDLLDGQMMTEVGVRVRIRVRVRVRIRVRVRVSTTFRVMVWVRVRVRVWVRVWGRVRAREKLLDGWMMIEATLPELIRIESYHPEVSPIDVDNRIRNEMQPDDLLSHAARLTICPLTSDAHPTRPSGPRD